MDFVAASKTFQLYMSRALLNSRFWSNGGQGFAEYTGKQDLGRLKKSVLGIHADNNNKGFQQRQLTPGTREVMPNGSRLHAPLAG